MTDNIISYIDMCRREGAGLQQGMNFGLGGNHSVIDPLPDAEQGARTIPIVRTGKLEPDPFLAPLPVRRHRTAPRRR